MWTYVRLKGPGWERVIPASPAEAAIIEKIGTKLGSGFDSATVPAQLRQSLVKRQAVIEGSVPRGSRVVTIIFTS